MTGVLNTEQIARFHEDGYIIVPGLFDREETDLLHNIACADRDLIDGARGSRDGSGNISRLKIRNELYDDMYSMIVRCNRVAGSATQLLDDEVYHFHHKMMVKDPRVGGAWEWHQDFGYWYLAQHVMFPDMLSVAVAVNRANKENGCMQVIKGSQKCGRIEHGKTGDQTGADMEKVNALLDFYKLELVYAELEPGDALFFHSNTLHRSDANRSENPRWTLISCYNTKHNDRYKKSPHGHPAYSKMDIVDDGAVKQVGLRQWKEIQGNA